MGVSNSKHSCTNTKSSTLKKKWTKKRSSSIHEIVKDFNSFLRTADNSTIRKQVCNYFTITSTRSRIEFVHGKKDSNQKIPWVNIEDFQFSSLLGTGGFGAVYKAQRKSTGKEYALKIQPMETMVRSSRKAGAKVDDLTSIHMERTVLASCRGHPFIVQLEYAFHTEVYAILGLEYVPGGTLSSMISCCPQRRLPFELCKVYTIELCLALHFMHCKGIIYRDLKGHLKVTDFGLAGAIVKYKREVSRNIDPNVAQRGRFDPELVDTLVGATKHDEPTGSTDSVMSESSSQDRPEISYQEKKEANKIQWVRRRTVCGTAGYRPPEQVQGRYLDYHSRHGYDERADWFSLGVCSFTMLTGRRPFPTKKELLHMDSKRNVTLDKEAYRSKSNMNGEAADRLLNDVEYRCLMFEVTFPQYIEKEPHIKSFLNALLARNPENRPRYNEIRNHPWMGGGNIDDDKISAISLPLWVIDHVNSQSIRNNTKSQEERSLTECIESLCSENFDKHGAAYAENFALKWSTLASTRTFNLFRDWNYMSDDIFTLETKPCGKDIIKRQGRTRLLLQRLSKVFDAI